MTISRCFLLCAELLLPVSLALADPSVQPRAEARSEDTLVWAVRVEKLPSSGSCQGWGQALEEATEYGIPFGKEGALRAWEPWESGEQEAVGNCESQPCKIKLNDAEVVRLAGQPKGAARLEVYLKLLQERLSGYSSTQVRRGYEFPGDPVEPWKKMEALLPELKTPLARPEGVSLRFRKVDLGSDSRAKDVQPIRQALDRRLARAPDGREVVVWVRDAYTDHYFESWGEWFRLRCEGEGNVTLTQGLLFELDLLKKNDLFSKLMRGRLRQNGKEQALKFLEANSSRLRSLLKP